MLFLSVQFLIVNYLFVVKHLVVVQTDIAVELSPRRQVSLLSI